MYIFDSHVHIFPQKIAEKASVNIGKFYDIPMEFNGSVDSLLEIAEKAGINKCLVHSVATTEAQVEIINNFIAESVKAHSELFVGFCSLHPSMSKEKIEAEIDRASSLGLLGIKLHPDFQLFHIDDRKAYDIYEVAEDRHIPILFHTGDYRYQWSSPERLARALRDFPKLTAIGAHFGGWSEWDNGVKYLTDNENVFVDTSSSFYLISPEKAKEYISAFGADRVLFGSDYPMWNVADDIEFMKKLDLPQDDFEKIMFKNACKLLNVTV